jgi:hypothetical protein
MTSGRNGKTRRADVRKRACLTRVSVVASASFWPSERSSDADGGGAGEGAACETVAVVEVAVESAASSGDGLDVQPTPPRNREVVHRTDTARKK